MEHERSGPGGRDPYELLGVAPDATRQEIVRAYHRAAQRAHPDTQPQDPGAQARFRALTDAYEVLSDPARRAGYDRKRRGHGQLRRGGAARGAGNDGDLWGPSGRSGDDGGLGRSGLLDDRVAWGEAAGSGPIWAGPVQVEPLAAPGPSGGEHRDPDVFLGMNPPRRYRWWSWPW